MTHLGGLQRSFPTFLLMAAPFRWLTKSRQRVLCVVLILLWMVTAPPVWWATQLMGLPDIGDPFDVEAFRAMTIPDDRNSFVLYRQALALYTPLRFSDTSPSVQEDLHTRWSTAPPEVRRWAEVNRDALAHYRRGADRPDALDSSVTSSVGGYVEFDALRPFQRLALLEASRLEKQGDMAGAWGWFRTYLRTIHHVGLYGTIYRRMVTKTWHNQLRNRLTEWVADPRTTSAQLHRALDDVIACEALVPSESYALKAEYLLVDKTFDERNNLGRPMLPAWLTILGSWEATRSLRRLLTPEQIQSISVAWRTWRRESERSQRVIRLVTANRLAYYELPPDRRPSPDPNVLSCDLYPFRPEAPAKARVLSPKALGAWLDSTHDARELIGFLNWRRLRSTELANHAALVILLGTELYRRDHGTDPPTPEALVGRYLKSLPVLLPDAKRDEVNPVADIKDN
jgi:hypothetical protein